MAALQRARARKYTHVHTRTHALANIRARAILFELAKNLHLTVLGVRVCLSVASRLIQYFDVTEAVSPLRRRTRVEGGIAV